MTVRTVGIGSSVPINSTAKISSAFNVQSNVMRIVAKGKSAHVAINTGTAATNEDFFILAGEEETISITKGSQAVVGITTGTTTVLEAPEGTQMPFIIGDYVTLDTANDTNYTTLIKHVKVTDVQNTIPSIDGGGFRKSRITVAANTSGITTAYNSSSGGSVMTSHKLSAIIADGETASSTAALYFQQVQRTG